MKTIAWKQVIMALIIGASVSAVATSDSSSFENIGDSVSLSDVAANPEKFEGETVTVTGMKPVGSMLKTENGDYINLDCSGFKENFVFQAGDTYTVTGKVVERQNRLGQTEWYLECTERPG